MASKTIDQMAKECYQIVNTPINNDHFIEKVYTLIKKSIEQGSCKYISYIQNPCNNYNELDDELKEKIVGLKAVFANLYWNRYLHPVINGIKYYSMNVNIQDYIDMLKLKTKSKNGIDDLINFFDCMCKYNTEFQKCILKEIQCDMVTHSSLLNCIKKNKIEDFINIIKADRLNVNDAIELCSKHESFFNKTLHIQFNEQNQRPDTLETKACESALDYLYNAIQELYTHTSTDIMDIVSDQDFIDLIDLLLSYCSKHYQKYITEIERSFLVINLYCEGLCNDMHEHFMKALTTTEFEYFNKMYELSYNILTRGIFPDKPIIFHDSTTQSLYEKFLIKARNELKVNKKDAKFELPSDLFETNQHLTHHNKNEFFIPSPDKKICKSPEILSNLINELADWGYINNDNETKTLFAYRFTGKKILRPVELKAIQWNEQGRSKRGYSLLHLIKKLTYDTGTYSKVKEFFTGLEWGEKLNEDANEKNASIRFKRLLHKISPEDFPDPDEK